MTDQTNTPATHWAVLVGINYYVKGPCLKGSVRDAETVKQYLEAGSTHVDIAILTATTPSEPNSTRPPEKACFWPTRVNVVSSLARVLVNAKPGDFVYIHYSGHGTRRKESAVTPHKEAGNLALVLFEDNEHGSSYLRGIELASCIRKMVKRGLLVTLVLDCCYSGSVLRIGNERDTVIRSTEYDPTIDAASTPILGADFLDSDNGLRNSRIPVDRWLVDPDGYTILSACGPHERAWEIETGGSRKGALTYFLIDALSALRKTGANITHQALYQNIRSRFHASWPQQTPMRYGNENFSFFGSLVVADKPFVSVYRTDDGRLCLAAGEAHGVHEGDEYAVHPFGQSDHATAGAEYEYVIVKVGTVRCLTSELVEIESSRGTTKVETGWKAKLVTHFSPKKIPVLLMANVNNPDQWIQAARKHHFLSISTQKSETEPYVFGVAVNESKEYEIRSGTNEKIIHVPTVPLEMNGASRAAMQVLQHLTTFKYFEGVENRRPSPSFESSFSLLPATSAGESGAYAVRHGETWGFTVQNLGSVPDYILRYSTSPHPGRLST